MMNMTKAFATNHNNLVAIYENAGYWMDEMIDEMPKKERKNDAKVMEHLTKRAEEFGFRITKKEMKELMEY
jgi:hypothetical protein